MTLTNMRGDPLVNLKTSRVEALSDGVFAIAMTILVLNISVPTSETVSADRLPDALGRVAPQVIVYIISFVNLGGCGSASTISITSSIGRIAGSCGSTFSICC